MLPTEQQITDKLKSIFGPDSTIKVTVVKTDSEEPSEDEKKAKEAIKDTIGGVLLKMAMAIAKDAVDDEEEGTTGPEEGVEAKNDESEGEYGPVLTISLSDPDERVEFGVKENTLIVRTTSDVTGRRLRRVAVVDGLTDASQVSYMIDRVNLKAMFFVDLLDDDIDFIDCDDESYELDEDPE